MFTRIFFPAVFLMGLSFACDSLAGLSQGEATDVPAGQPKKQDVIHFLDLEAPLPGDWVQQKPTNAMRLAQCRVPAVPGSEAGELVVYYFGHTRATLNANIARWQSQFSGHGGQPVKPLTTTLTVGELPVTLIEFQGGYARGIGVGPSGDVKPDQTMIVAVVDVPTQGLVYIQLHGPSATVGKNRAAFEGLIKGIHKSLNST